MCGISIPRVPNAGVTRQNVCRCVPETGDNTGEEGSLVLAGCCSCEVKQDIGIILM
jgi:hypothetical protein